MADLVPGTASSEQPRRNASKYDFVKVKVWLGENLSHYYVLSRFLICRMLTVTKIKHTKAVKIALELKKYLVDRELLEVSQDKLETILFDIMHAFGFGPEFVSRYKMVTRFFQQRRPLIILLCGVPCTGKSTIAQQLASVLNLPNVLQTDVICELLRMLPGVPLGNSPLWERGLAGSELIQAFQHECHAVRKGLDGDLVKCIRDGKSMIIEGSHLDPGLFLYEFGRYGMQHMQARLNKPQLPAEPHGVADLADGPPCNGDATSRRSRPVSAARAPQPKRRQLGAASFMLEADEGGMSPKMARGSNSSFQGFHTDWQASSQSVASLDASPPLLPMSPASEWLASGSLHHLPVQTLSFEPPHSLHQRPDNHHGMLPATPTPASRQQTEAQDVLTDDSACESCRKTRSSLKPSQQGAHVAAGVAASMVHDDSASNLVGTHSRRHKRSKLKQWWKQRLGPRLTAAAASAPLEPLLAPASPQERPSLPARSHAAKKGPGLGSASPARDQAGAPADGASSPRAVLDFREAESAAGVSACCHPCSAQPRTLSAEAGACTDTQPAVIPGAACQPHPGSTDATQLAAQLSANHLQPPLLAQPSNSTTRLPCHNDQDACCTWQPAELQARSAKLPASPSCTPQPLKFGSKAHAPAPSAPARQSQLADEGRVPPQHDPAQAGVQHARQHRSTHAFQDAPSAGPVFVPVVLRMDAQYHAPLLEEWHRRHQSPGQDEDTEVFSAQLQQLQDYLCSYAACNVPIVDSSLSDITQVVDQLHDYLLQCIKMAMMSDGNLPI